MADPASPPPAPPGRSALDALARRVPLPTGWATHAVHALLLVAISISAAFVISPGLYGQQIPELKQEDVGRPFRANSPSGFKAGRDYEIVHQAMTEQRRMEARAAVRPVYDSTPGVLPDLRDAVHGAFSLMQAEVGLHEVEKAAPHLSDDTPEREHPAPAHRARKGADDTGPLEEKLRDARRDFEQKVFGRSDSSLEDEDFQALAGARFAVEVEQAVLSLLERAYVSEIAGERGELSREGADGITIRDVQNFTEQARPAAAPSVIDVREAQTELERFVSIPGNLLPDKPVLLKRAVLRLAKRLIRPNLTINAAETNDRRRRAAEAVKEAVISLKKGQKVIGDGELINDTHLVVVKGMRAQTRELDLFQLQMGGTGLVGLLVAACYAFCRAAFRGFRPTRKDALLLSLLLVGMLALLHISVGVEDAIHDHYGQIPPEALHFCIPVAAGAMLIRFILSAEMALYFAIVFSCLAGVLLGNSLAFGIFTLVGSLVAADRITRAKDRVGVFRAGVWTGVANVLVVTFLSLAEGKGFTTDTLVTAGFTFFGTSLAVPATVMALMPLVEVAFGYASDIKLLELANLNHPALKELIVQAPGTYHHSIILGSLVENAAEAIGANPLLARSCAYYHDIGKGRNPLYFGENQKGESRHDALAPAMSAVIIKRHVTEGLEMARQYRLPKLVADAIPQHHGTRLVGYFFHKALKEQEGKENPQPIDESVYRYPGPKPQFREAALVMIADAVEASCRSLPEPSSAKLQAQVQKMINVIFSEGQLDECDLTLKDLNLIAQSFVHTLEGIYHARPVYPPGAVGGQRPPPEGSKAGGSTLHVAGAPALADDNKPEPKRSAGG